MRFRRPVERAHADRDDIHGDRIPEQERAAHRTESAPHLFRGAVPGELVTAHELQCAALNIRRCPIVTRLLAALTAMTGIGSVQFTRHLEAYCAAKARPFMHYESSRRPARFMRDRGDGVNWMVGSD